MTAVAMREPQFFYWMGLKLNVCTVKCHTVTDVFVFGPAPQSPAVMFNLNVIGWQCLADKMAGGEGFGSLHPYI